MKQKILLLLACLLCSLSAWAVEVDNRTIYYTTESGEVTWPKGCSAAGHGFSLFGAKIVSNTYEGGQGKIVFDGLVTLIGEYAFGDNKNLKSIIIPEGVTSIGFSAFGYCEKLQSVIIPSTVTSLQDYAFQHCYELTSINIPEGVKSIYRVAFTNCTKLSTLTLPNTLTFIGEDAFFNCFSLTSLVIPNSVTTIKEAAFEKCTGLTSVTLSNQLTELSSLLFYNCFRLKSVEIPSGVTKINSAFSDCTGLESVVIPETVTEMSGCFKNCSSLRTVVIPNSVEYFGGYTFYGCTSLESVTLSSSLRRIYNYDFYNCPKLTSIDLPATVTTIDDYAFAFCSSLSSITCRRSTPHTCGTDAFKGVNTSACTLYVPGESVITYSAKEPWSKFTNVSSLSGLPIVYYEGNSTPKTAASVAEANSSAQNTLYFSEAIYDESTAEANVVYRKPDGSWYAKEISLKDGYPFYCPVDVEVGTVKYTRTLSYAVWNPITLPFSLNYDDWKDKVNIAELSGVHIYEDGRPTLIEFITVNSGDLVPNIPYVIKPINTGEFTLEATNKTLKASPAENSTYVSSGSSRWSYNIYGNFQPVAYDYLVTKECKIFGLDKDMKLVFGAPVNDLTPFRFYLLKEKSPNGYWPETRSVGEELIYVMVDGKLVSVEDATSITSPMEDSEARAAYNLNGQKVGAGYKGIVIENGRKVIRK